MEIIPIILLGWPSALIGIVLLAIGIQLKSYKLRIAGAIIATGFCLLASLYPPPTRYLGLSAIICNSLSTFRYWEKSRLWAYTFLLPMLVLICWLAYAVLSQQT